MASKMAVSKAPKTYMTHIIDQKHFNFDFLWMFRSKIIQTIKWNIVLIKKVEMFKMASKMAVS